MPVSSGRSKIDYEKIEEEDRLSMFIEQLKGRLEGVPYDVSDLLYYKDLYTR